MYPQRTVYPFQPGFLPIPQRPPGAGIQTGYTATGPAPQQPQQSPLGGLGTAVGAMALRSALSSPAPLYSAADAGAALDAADAASPYAANALLANGADPEIMAQLAAEGSTTADLGLKGAAGAGAASGAAGAGAASGAAAGGAAAAEGAGAAAGAEGAGLLGMGALGPIALGGLGIYGLGSLLDWW